MLNCDWRFFEYHLALLKATVQNKSYFPPAVTSLYIFDSLTLQKSIAEYWRSTLYEVENYKSHKLKHDKIRVAYFSPDIREHSLTKLLASVFESHNKDKFVIYCFNTGEVLDHGMQLRLRQVFDYFFDVETYSDSEITELFKKHEIDIAVNLIGYFGDHKCRPNVFSRRCAPIQINYTYAGTMGLPTMDYIIGDKVTLPTELLSHYSESIIQLPDCWYTLDLDSQEINTVPISNLGIPDDKFIMCCLNAVYKMNPFIFRAWIEVLIKNKHAVLVIRGDNKIAVGNIKKFLGNYAPIADQIIFIDSLDPTVYASLLNGCDLYLDTYPYGAHTVAMEAAYWGLPVISLKGKSFASRVASSIFSCLDCEELSTYSIEEYLDKINLMIENPEKLKEIKNKIIRNREKSSIFDAKKFTEYLENAYISAYERRKNNLPKEHILCI
jgi:predicted O-linked N-acetylglucosamine transferase (SPINDLY family)